MFRLRKRTQKCGKMNLPHFPVSLLLSACLCMFRHVHRGTCAPSSKLTLAHCLLLTQHLCNREREYEGNGLYSL